MLAADSAARCATQSSGARPGPSQLGNSLQRFALKSEVNVVGHSIAFSAVNLELDGNSGEGVLTYAADGRQTLQGTLAVEGLNLTPYISAFRILAADRSWSQIPLELDALKGIDVDLRISAARVTLEDVNLGRTAVAANLRGGNLTLAIGESQAFGGLIRGSLALAKSTAGADLQAQLQFNDRMLRAGLWRFPRHSPNRRPGRHRHCRQRGRCSIYELAKALNGSITMSSRKGAIAGVNVEQSLKRLEQNPLSARGNDFRGGKTPYDELTVNLKVTDGTAHAEDVRIEAPAMRIGMAGTPLVDPGAQLRPEGNRKPAS